MAFGALNGDPGQLWLVSCCLKWLLFGKPLSISKNIWSQEDTTIPSFRGRRTEECVELWGGPLLGRLRDFKELESYLTHPYGQLTPRP